MLSSLQKKIGLGAACLVSGIAGYQLIFGSRVNLTRVVTAIVVIILATIAGLILTGETLNRPHD